MKTDDLINTLVQDGSAPRTGSRLGMTPRTLLALAAGGLIAIVLFALSLGVRGDIDPALHTWRFVAKVAIMVASFLAALRVIPELARPTADLRKALPAFLLPLALIAAAVAVELVTTPVASWSVRAVGSNGLLCLSAIAAFSVAPLVALLLVLRSGAPASPGLAGAGAGLLAGTLAASLYAVHCFDDSPLFVALWYVPAVAMIVFVARLVGGALLRW